jgi:hypothetical protein
LRTAKERLTSAAGANCALPGWLATSVQLPVVSSLTCGPFVVQTLEVIDVSVTGSPDVAETFAVKVGLRSDLVRIGGKLIAWAVCDAVTLNDCVTATAAA